MGNSTGLMTGTSARPTNVASEYSVSTAVDPASNATACGDGSQSTTTIYSTDFVTSTVTIEDNMTAQPSSATLASVGSSFAASDKAPTNTGEIETSLAAAPSDATEVSTAAAYASSAESITSQVPSATTTSPAENTISPVASLDSSDSSSTMKAPGEFYQVSRSQSVSSTTDTPPAPSSATPDSSMTRSISSSGTGKRGLAYNSAALTNAFAGKSMAWAYNWGANPSGALASGIEFVPMLWGQKAFGGWDDAAKAALASGSKHLLSFNEADFGGQANMDTATAAAAHIKYMNPYAGQARIGTPAVTNGGPNGGTDGMGVGWMQKFFDKCAGNCKVDFLAFHWYDAADNVAYFKNYVTDVIAMAKKNGVNKVWLTEFAASGSDQQVAKFLGEVLPWLDSNDSVERYAYYMCTDGMLVSGTSISDPVGKAYIA